MDFLHRLLDGLETIEQALPKETRCALCDLPYSKLSYCHFGIGTDLRNTFLLPESELYKGFMQSGITAPDDMSAFLLRLLYVDLNDKRTQKVNKNSQR